VKPVKFNKTAGVLAIAMAIALLTSPVQAASKAVSMSRLPSSVAAGKKFVISGITSETLNGANVRIQLKKGGQWKTVKKVRSSKTTGKWSTSFTAPKSNTALHFRAVSGGKTTKVQTTAVIAPLKFVAKGPGSRILGVDLSRWQSSDQQLDFNRMASAGVAFAFIKGSDGLLTEDALAIPHVKTWSPAAKSAGILVGYYHFARIPVSGNPKLIVSSARLQARQAAGRLATLGGYDARTLPYVLDIERVDAKVTDEMVTLWTFTWLNSMKKATGKTPIIYSYRHFLASRFLQDPVTTKKFRNYHLWLAQPGNPADPAVKVGQGLNGRPCYVSAWKQSDCTYVWTFWQYTNSGDRETYGIPWSPGRLDCPDSAVMCFPGPGSGRKHLDLNVFNGSSADLTALVNGKWERSAAEYR
jgi:GH25 family lysozyme M1 (1,4-beta-N-acetylmuramidase)